MQQHERAFIDLDTTVAIVTFETSLFARAYIEETGIHWLVLIDHTRSLYHAYGMLQGQVWDIWGPRTWWAYAKELARGRRPKAARADTSQLGGDVLIDPAGTVRLLHVGSGPADRPLVAEILRARQSAPTPPQ